MKYPIDIEKCAIDFLSISGHKIHGIKGVGALYVRQPEKLKPLIFGGGQEQGLRSGTENTVGIIALGKAVEIAQRDFKENLLKLELLREYFVTRISEIDDTLVNSPEDGARHIVNVSFLGVPSEIMLHSLEEKGVYVSSGSACSAKKKGSRVLETFKLKEAVRNSAIRFSFSHQNTFAEIDQTIDILKNITSDIRMITRYKNKN
ncbi:MAG: aminotransferase class V-fold PLP-dependent enzyme, partial [Peptostreptococcaceae bacterium]|nr:aminotransferase class V-fold PLP-dependent enzyme [Peptostreptococcaceae bacterium]